MSRVAITGNAPAVWPVACTAALLQRKSAMPCRRCAVWLAVVAVALLACAGGCGKPPQLGTDEHVFSAADALLTAISAQDVKLLDQCAANMERLHAEGHLSAEAQEFLAGIITEARGGKWKSARSRLVAMIRAQRRPD